MAFPKGYFPNQAFPRAYFPKGVGSASAPVSSSAASGGSPAALPGAEGGHQGMPWWLRQWYARRAAPRWPLPKR